jgi:hypothetical protein
MQEANYLYIMLSRTGTGMGKVIRAFTHNEYNHVSLTLAPSFERFVSFARYTQGVALAGGFVMETPQRFLSAGQPVPVRIYRVDVTQERYEQLSSLFSLAESRTDLIYNSLGALLSTWHLQCHIPGTYTCLEFAAAVLGKSFRSLQELQSFLEPYEVCRGNLNELVKDNGDRSETYFTRRGFLRGTADTIAHFTRLTGRLLRISKCHDPIEQL